MPETTISQRVVALAGSASIEMSPREIDDIAAASADLRAGATVTITWMPRDSYEQRVAAACALRRASLEPVPHIAARRIESTRELRPFLARLRDEADVRTVFVIGGDVKRPLGPFASALELIDSGLLQMHGITAVGVAGYPEPHPSIDAAALEAAYDRKRAALATAQLDAFAMTQFSFDAAAIIALLRRRRLSGDTTRMRIGLAGPASLPALMRFAARCGVATSARGFMKNTGSMMKLMGEPSPEPILQALAALPDYDRLQPFGVHVFSFGGFARTAAWLTQLAGRGITPTR